MQRVVMVDLYSWLRCYLYAFFLIFISITAHAADPKTIAMGGFPYTVVCSHQTNLDYCVDARSMNAKETACKLWMTNLSTLYGYAFDRIITGTTTDTCLYRGKNPSNGTDVSTTQTLVTKNGLCPPSGNPPPTKVIFSRQGRWFPQELPEKRCFRNCNYSGGQSFTYKHFSFTNGIVTEFTDAGGLKSVEEFCDAVPEPVRNSEGEITYDAGCQDNMFKVFCDFVEWFRNDSEMPEAPKVEAESVNLGYIDAGHIVVQGDAMHQCFEPTIFKMYLPWGDGEEIEQEINYSTFCTKITTMGNIWRALYLIAACYVIFGGRK
ncbi:hypothetical protein ACYU0V_08855 [Acinetobacter sp. X9]